MIDFAYARERMVEQQLARRGIADERVLAAMREVPREAFVSQEMRPYAYDDTPLPIGSGQTISQPYVVAAMIEAAEISPNDRALEIGAGSGYAAAVMGRIAREVIAIERHEELARAAKERIRRLGYSNVDIRAGDGSKGLPEEAPFDVILAAAGGPSVPDVLKSQLAIGGRLVMPVGDSPRAQRLIKVKRESEDAFSEQDLGAVAFVPLIGEYGWEAEDDAM